MKNTLLASLLAVTSLSLFAADYYVVVPLAGKVAQIAAINVALNSYALPEAIVDSPYAGFDFKTVLAVTGDSAYNGSLVTWEVAAGSLPAGLTLNTNGTLSGTPTVAGTANFALKANYKTKTGQQAYQVVSLSIAVSLATATLPAAKVNAAYAAYDFKPLLSVAGDPNYNVNNATFSAAGIPSGMSLSSIGVLSGTPTTKNTSGANFLVLASYKTKTGQQAYTIVVNGASLQVTSISVGAQFACAVTTAGAAKCWGLNANGQLGVGTTTASAVPVTVSGLGSGVASIAAGSDQACVITTAGAAKCWGSNNGKLGNNSATYSPIPVNVSGLSSGVTSISTGGTSTCAVHNGAAKCWGQNGEGQLGNGTMTTSLVPTAVSNLTTGIASISVGNGAGNYSPGTCAVTVTGAAYCWGAGAQGQLGNGTTATKYIPTAVSGYETSGIASISAGAQHACAVTTSGSVMCWGMNTDGRVGDGTTTIKYTPTAVTGLASGVSSVSAGVLHSCAVTTAGAAYCWGEGGLSQLGDGTVKSHLTPTAVTGLNSGVTAISAGYYQSCAITTTGAKCWGVNSWGNLGDGTLSTQVVPVDVAQ